MHLLLVPGRGDNYAMFRPLTILWRCFGFNAKVWRFDWQKDDGNFTGRFDALLRHIDAMPDSEPVCIIGCSAGGTVAVNALLSRPTKVMRIVTISAPLTRDYYRNTVLSQSFSCMHNRLPGSMSLSKQVCSVTGYRDELVSPQYSHLPGSVRYRIPGWSHNSSIALAMTLCAWPLVRWIKKGAS